MKRLFFILFLTIYSLNIVAQNSGKGFSVQGIARDANGNVLANESISLLVRLMEEGTIDWEEIHNVTSDDYGVFNIIVGRGARQPVTGGVENFNELNFRISNYSVELRIEDGGSWVFLTNQELLSVPYAENSFDFPVGMIMPFGGTPEAAAKLAPNWLICDGRSLSQTDYPVLYSVIATSWGQGAGSNFLLPDLRGMFLRGLDQRTDETTMDPDGNDRISLNGGNSGRQVGSFQSDTVGQHTHPYVDYEIRNGVVSGQTIGAYNGSSAFNTSKTTGVNSGNESRPKNVYVIYLIKAK